MGHDHRTVFHDEEYVSAEGDHTNQAECLWSLMQPWLGKVPWPVQAGLGAGRSILGVYSVADTVGQKPMSRCFGWFDPRPAVFGGG